MGLPSFNLAHPDDLENVSKTICRFEITYSDEVEEYRASIITIEVDTVDTFDSPNLITSNFFNYIEGDIEFKVLDSGIMLSTVLHLEPGTYYWRAKGINPSGVGISMTRSFTIARTIQRTLSFYENIGKLKVWKKKRILALYENIAKLNVWTKTRALYQYENITSDPPFPYIYRLSNTRGTQGSSVTIYGNGFGYSPADDINNANRFLRSYDGMVTIGDKICAVLSWSWTEIVIQIPSDAESGSIMVTLSSPTVRTSNLKGFEVIPDGLAADTGLELFICDRDNHNTILCQVENTLSKSFQMLRNNPGAGSFTISRFDEKVASISDQAYVLCRLNGIDRFKWIIESISPTYVNSSEQQTLDISGRGLLALLERAVVYPTLPSKTLEREWKDTHAGAILKTLIEEAKARGVLSEITVDWTATEDSIGNAWTDLTDISFHAGTPLLEVLTRFTDGMGVFTAEISTTGTLRLYKSYGEDKSESARYFSGQAVMEHKNQNMTGKMANVVLVEGGDGTMVEVTHPTGPSTWGRRESYLQAQNIPNNNGKLESYGNQYLSTSADVDWGVQAKVIEVKDRNGNRLAPFESYLIGDYIGWYIPAEGVDQLGFNKKIKVVGITVETDSNSNVIYSLDLNSSMVEREIRMAQKVERMAAYSSSPTMTQHATKPAAPIEHNHDHGTLTGLGDDDHEQYLNASRHTADPHSGLARVTGVKAQGEDIMQGDVILIPGTSVSLSQNDNDKTITIDIVDAYDMAVLGGYSDTIAQFESDLAALEGLEAAILAITG